MAKINYKSINPRTLSRFKEDTAGDLRQLRSLYSGMRSILRKRNERIVASGRKSIFPTPAPIANVPQAELKKAVAKLAANLRSSQSTLTGKKLREQKISATLKEHKHDIPVNQLEDFGRFMKATYNRQGETYKGKSSVAATMYEEFRKLGVTGKTLANSFAKYLENYSKMNDLLNVAIQLKDNHPSTRVTGVELRAKIKELNNPGG